MDAKMGRDPICSLMVRDLAAVAVSAGRRLAMQANDHMAVGESSGE